jgi:hypothetical protein
MTTPHNPKLDAIKELVTECIEHHRTDFLSNLILVLQQNYKEIATLCTNGNYHEGWDHKRVMDYITYET